MKLGACRLHHRHPHHPHAMELKLYCSAAHDRLHIMIPVYAFASDRVCMSVPLAQAQAATEASEYI